MFIPHDVPGLYESFFADQDKFKEIYERAERNTRLRKKTIQQLTLFSAFMEERKNTGRIYLMNVDHANTHGSFIEEVAPSSNQIYVVKLILPTKPLNHIEDPEGEISFMYFKCN